MIRWTIQFPEGDLQKLRDLQRQTRINGREWMGALLAALVEYHEATSSVTLPLAVVPAVMPNEQDYYRHRKSALEQIKNEKWVPGLQAVRFRVRYCFVQVLPGFAWD
jgi:hypothetical protein